MSVSLTAIGWRASSPAHLGLALREVGRLSPVYYDEGRRCWVISRYRDLVAVLRDTDAFTNEIYERGPMGGTFVSRDGADHARHRRVYSRVFGPKVVGRFEGIVAASARATIDQVVARGEGADLVGDFCLKFPVDVIRRLLGLSVADIEPCQAWVRDMMEWMLFFYDAEAEARGRRALAATMDRVRPVVEAELRRPGDGLLGSIIEELRADGLLEEERVTQIATGLLLAGYETTTWMLAGAVGALLLHPEVLAQVRADPARLMPAVEESMRWSCSFLGALRLTRRAVEVAGVTIPADSPVLICTAAAHYDDEAFPRPEVFDPARRAEHLLFLIGPHYCLGAPLARLEARLGLSLLLDRLPGLRLDPAAPPTWVLGVRGSVLHGPESLRVLFERPAEAHLPAA